MRLCLLLTLLPWSGIAQPGNHGQCLNCFFLNVRLDTMACMITFSSDALPSHKANAVPRCIERNFINLVDLLTKLPRFPDVLREIV